jgi:hypothetical protein
MTRLMKKLEEAPKWFSQPTALAVATDEQRESRSFFLVLNWQRRTGVECAVA